MLANNFSHNSPCQQSALSQKRTKAWAWTKEEDNFIASVGKRNSQFNREYYKYYNRVISESRLKSSWIAAVKNALASGLNMRVHSWRNFTSNILLHGTHRAGEKEQCILLMTPGRKGCLIIQTGLSTICFRGTVEMISEQLSFDKCITGWNIGNCRARLLRREGNLRNLNSTFWNMKIPQVSQEMAVRG